MIPGIGPSLAADLRLLGFEQVVDLVKADPQAMYDQLCALTKTRQDPCVLYTFRCAVYFARTPTDKRDRELLKWWHWKDRQL